jgi:hypothetical protein
MYLLHATAFPAERMISIPDEFEAKVREITEALMSSGFTAIVDSDTDFIVSSVDDFECLGSRFYVQVNIFKR